MSLTPEQRAERRQGIGGSDAAALMGRHPTKTPLALWLDKVHGIETDETMQMEAGNRLESVIREWAADTLAEVVSVPTATLRHPLEPRMLANTDGILASGRVLECKNVSDLSWRASEGERVDGVLKAHWWQVQHYIEVLDAPGAVVAYLLGGSKLELVEVARCKPAGEVLRIRIGEWWQRHVVGNEPPPEGTPEDRVTALERIHAKQSKGMLRTDNADLIALARDYETASKTIEGMTKAREELKAELCAAIGPDSGLDFGKAGKVTWKADKNGKRTFRVTLRDAPETE